MNKDIEVRDGEVIPYQDWMDALPLIKTSDSVAADMVAGILQAESLDDVEALNETIGLKDLIGQVITVCSAELRESEVESGYPVYAVMDAISDTTGNHMVVTSGSGKVLAQLCKYQMMKAYPRKVRVIGIESNSHKGRVTVQFVSATDF